MKLFSSLKFAKRWALGFMSLALVVGVLISVRLGTSTPVLAETSNCFLFATVDNSTGSVNIRGNVAQVENVDNINTYVATVSDSAGKGTVTTSGSSGTNPEYTAIFPNGTYTATLYGYKQNDPSNTTYQCSRSKSFTVAVPVSTPSVPVVSLSVNPSSGTVPFAPSLTWSATNSPTSCNASGQWSGTKPTSGSNVTQTPLTTAGAYTYTLYCSNAGGASSPVSVTVTANAVGAQQARVTATAGTGGTVSSPCLPNPVVVGADVTCSNIIASSGYTVNSQVVWSPNNCQLDGSFTNSSRNTYVARVNSDCNFSFTFTPSAPAPVCSSAHYACSSGTSTGTTGDTSTQYNWSCGNGSTTVFCSEPKNSGSIPVVTISASPTSGVAPVTPSLTWSATNSPTSCNASGQWSGTKPTSGSNVAQTPLNSAGTYTYTLACSNAAGTSSTKNATVTVTAPSSSQPDLTASTPSQSAAVIGTAQTFTSTISNAAGAGATGASFANVFQVATGAGGSGTVATYAATPASMAALAAGGTAQASYSYTFSGAPRTWSVRFCADNTPSMSGGTIAESSEGNNCSGAWRDVATTNNPYVDLTAAAVAPTTATVNVAQTFSSVISNGGSASTGASFPTLFQTSTLVNGGGTVTDYPVTPNMAALAGGGTASTSKSITFASTGTLYIRACADKSSASNTGVISEVSPGSESNNCSTYTALTISNPVMSGTLTPAANSCTIASGASTCNINFSWTTTNPAATSAVTKPTNVTVANGNSGTNAAFAVKYNTETFYLYNNSVLLDQKTVSSSCISGTSWDGTKCLTDANPGPGGAGNTCANGATNYPTCTINVSGSCVNGATNPPTCTTGIGTLVNGTCAVAHYGCVAGTMDLNVSGTSSWTWRCAGSGAGATSVSCVELKKKPIFIED